MRFYHENNCTSGDLPHVAVLGFAQEDGRDMKKEDRLGWWRESRFGMFIHWGPVSIKGIEISCPRGGEQRHAENAQALEKNPRLTLWFHEGGQARMAVWSHDGGGTHR